MSALAKIQEIQELAEDRFRRHWGEAQILGRKTVEQAWYAGEALIEVKVEMGHGGWGDWLAAEDIGVATACRLIELVKRAPQICQVARFGTVDEAMKSLPAHKPKGKPRGRPAPPKPDPVLSPAEETEVRLEEQTQRADALDSELADAKDQIDVMERSGGKAEGMVAKSDHETLKKEYSETWDLLKKRDRKLSKIKRDLLNGQTADDVLRVHFRVKRT